MAILAKGGEFAPAVIFLIVAEARMSVFTFLYIAIFNQTRRIYMSKLAFFPKGHGSMPGTSLRMRNSDSFLHRFWLNYSAL